MNFDDFKRDAIRTESRPDKLHINPGAMVGALIMALLAAEVLDMYKKAAFYGKPMDMEALSYKINSLQTQVEELNAEMPLLLPENRDVEDVGLTDKEGNTVKLTHELIPIRLVHAVTGMFTESGEMIEAVINSIVSGQPVDATNMGEESGDMDWYKAILFDTLGLDETSIRAAVIAKLKKRYGEKFSAEAAVNRDLAAERTILEDNVVVAK